MTKKELCQLLRIPIVGKFPTSRKREDSTSTTSKRDSKRSTSKRDSRRVSKIDDKGQYKEENVFSNDCIASSKVPLRPDQVKAVNHLMQNRGLILAFKTGEGKTLVAVVSAYCWLSVNRNNTVVVVLSPSLKGNFQKEMVKYGADPDDERFSFYSFSMFAKTFGNSSSSSKRCTSNIMLIIDEAHELRTKVKPSKPTRASIAISCARKVGKILLLTATPVYNAPRDVINLLAMVKGEKAMTETEFEKLINNEKRFVSRFRNTVMTVRADRVEDKKTESVFVPSRGLTMSCGKYQRRSPDFPQVKHCEVNIMMDKEFYEEYIKIERKESFLKVVGSNPWLFYTGLRQASNSIDICLKCDFIMEVIKRGHKVLVQSSFLERGIEMLEERLDSSNIKYVKITGQMSGDERTKAVKDYNRKKANVMLISRAGSQGIDLRGTRYVVIMEPGWNENAEEQAEGRAARFKSHEGLKDDKVTVYRLYVIKPYFQWQLDDMLDDGDITKAELKTYKSRYPVRSTKDITESADVIIRSLSLKKTQPINRMMDLMDKISI